MAEVQQQNLRSKLIRFPQGSLAVISPAASMRDIIEARRQTGLPVLLADGGELVGIVGDEDIYTGLLHRATS